MNTLSGTPPQQAATLSGDQTIQYGSPLVNNEPTPLDENYPSTMADGDLASTMATMVATRFPSIDQSRLQEIFSKTLENVTEENQRKALQPYVLQDVPTQILPGDNYNSLGFNYQLFAGENHGFNDEENDGVW